MVDLRRVLEGMGIDSREFVKDVCKFMEKAGPEQSMAMMSTMISHTLLLVGAQGKELGEASSLICDVIELVPSMKKIGHEITRSNMLFHLLINDPEFLEIVKVVESKHIGDKNDSSNSR